MEHVFVFIEMLHKGYDAPLVAEALLPGRLLPMVRDGDLKPLVQKGQLPHPAGEGIEAILHLVENFPVRQIGDGGAAIAFPAGSHHLHPGDRVPMVVFLAVDLAVPAHLRHQPCGQGVYHRQPHPMEAAGYLIAAAAEFAAGVEHRQRDLQGAFAHFSW